jgi:predicted nucleotidyltransferase
MTPAGEGRPNAVAHDVFPVDFRDFIHELNTHKVEYLLVGGYAVGMYGHVRATIDIDFFYRPSPENVTRLLHALVAFGAPEIVVDREQLARPNSVTQFGEPPVRIDLLSSISGVSFDDAKAEQVELEIAGEMLPVIGLAALRANKRASGRKQDRDDLKRLRSP